MEQRKFPFQFSDTNQAERRSEFLKRFGFRPEEDRGMFCEATQLSPEWPDWHGRFHHGGFGHGHGDGSNSPSESNSSSPNICRKVGSSFSNWNCDEEEIPIKVIHQKGAPMKTSGEYVCTSESETSSQGSDAQPGQSQRRPLEPRIYHIPILVEPRDGSTSSGYASDGTSEEAKTRSHQQHPSEGEDWGSPSIKQLRQNFENRSSSSGSQGSTWHSLSNRQDSASQNCPARGNCDSESPHTSTTKVFYVPIKKETQEDFPKTQEDSPQLLVNHQDPCSSLRAEEPHSGNNFSSKGCHVTRININGGSSHYQGHNSDLPCSTQQQNSSTISDSCDGPSESQQLDPFQQIAAIRSELDRLKIEVTAFDGSTINRQKKYGYLDEMLTRCMLKLDDVITLGDEEVRKARRAVIKDVQQCIAQLEAKVKPLSEDCNEETVSNATVKDGGESYSGNEDILNQQPEEQEESDQHTKL
ncbi:BAG domain-containing protein Samui-like [Limulus polyphemus]|uniref:BAG domain-containing protein Samui-like n=1 Tax=Limulus polyphemus TaxID=6850 RepID=A0ABM1BJA6_LIMPO|nr:BAG domain-containing protein Samui-like [Limulus polyphemus]